MGLKIGVRRLDRRARGVEFSRLEETEISTEEHYHSSVSRGKTHLSVAKVARNGFMNFLASYCPQSPTSIAPKSLSELEDNLVLRL